jgi:CRISPR/Cas system CSM-associated protein Csm3 (group 7 of RAMP superfamily)
MKKQINIELLTLAPLAISTGKNDGLVDNDILTDEYGIPYINQRRLKGLLKESVIETLEICGNKNIKKIITYLFGEKGSTLESNSNRLSLSDARVINYNRHKLAVQYKHIPTNFVKFYYATVIQQTAIDDQYKTAKKGSLRKIRAVKEGQKFSFALDIHPDFENLIKLAILQWSFMGSGRNNGLGNVKLIVKNDAIVLDQGLIDGIANLDIPISKSTNVQANTVIFDSSQDTLALKIELIDKVLITGGSIGDQNTIQTKTYIDGRSIWGILANKYISTYGIDDDFRSIFRDGKINFAPAFLDDSLPISSHRQGKRKSEGKTLYNAFDQVNENESLRPKDGYLIFQENDGTPYLIQPTTISAFHFNRENYRRSGVSENGEIFYYDALEKGQVFLSQLKGLPSCISKLKTLIGEGLDGRMGASRGIEYGRVRISVKEQNTVTNAENENPTGQFIFYFTSPGLIVNEHGFASPTISNLRQALIDKGFGVQEIKLVSKFNNIQSHSGVWKSMTSHESYFDIGTAIQVTLETSLPFNDIESKLNEGIGLNINQGYGQVKVVEQDFSSYQVPQIDKIFLTEKQIEDAKKFNLFVAYENHSKQLEIKTKALGEAKNSKHISINNHQISRIKTMIDDIMTNQELSDDKMKFDQLAKELKELGNKPIPGILDKLKRQPNLPNNYSDFKTYMTAYLDGKRMINNTKKRQTNDSN